MSTLKKTMSSVTVLKNLRKVKEQKDVLSDVSMPLYISQWKMDGNKKKCSVEENMEVKARALTEDGAQDFPVQVKCMRHPKQQPEDQLANALSFDTWYNWLTGKKNIMTPEKFNGTVIFDYHGFCGIRMKVPLSWKIDEKNDKKKVKMYKTALNKYRNEDFSFGEEGMVQISPIHIYHFFLRPMFDLGYDIKKVMFLGCHSASIVEAAFDLEQKKKIRFSMMTEMASVLKRFKRYGITITGNSQVFMIKGRGGSYDVKVTGGAVNHRGSDKDWETYRHCIIKYIRKISNAERQQFEDQFLSMKSEQGRDWFLGAYPRNFAGCPRIYDEKKIGGMNLDNSPVDIEEVQKIPTAKKAVNQFKIQSDKEFDEGEELEAGPCLYKSDLEFFYELFPEEREEDVEEEVPAVAVVDVLGDNDEEEEEEEEEYVARYIDYDDIDWLDEE